MTPFSQLFGIDSKDIQKNCILVPVMTKNLLAQTGLRDFVKGRLYSCGNTRNATYIHTRISAAFTADAVLYLKETACENIFLFGSCGLVCKKNELKLGSIVSNDKAYSYESFSSLLDEEYEPASFDADEELLERICQKDSAVQRTTGATFASIFLEKDYAKHLAQRDINTLDMECSAVFAAARHINKKAASLFYVTDILGKSSPFRMISPRDKEIITGSINQCLRILDNCTKN